MLELNDIAIRLDNEENLRLKYRSPVSAGNGVEWETRTDKLLDVAEESGVLYVERDGEPVWVKAEEAIEVVSEGTVA